MNLPFQMAFYIGFGAFIGLKLDRHFQLEQPLFTILLSVAGLLASFYVLIKDLNKDSK